MAPPKLSLSEDVVHELVTALERSNHNFRLAAISMNQPESTVRRWANHLGLVRGKLPLRPLRHPPRHELFVDNGMVVVFSDAHFWPGITSTAYRALIKFCALHRTDIKAIICNGDALDGASISRHPPICWEERPTLLQEIETCKERIGEIESVIPNAERIWTRGNHDARMESRLASSVPEFAGVSGMAFHDQFPLWQHALSCWINDDVVVKHRFKGGVHATHNNAVSSGKTIVTGHLHSLKVAAVDDYNGRRWGVDTGTLADPNGPQFAYSEDAPQNHRSGFAVLTFENGELRWPELVAVVEDGRVEWRGKSYLV